MFGYLFKCVLIFLYVCSTKCQNPEVEIPQGRLRGGLRTNLDGGTYYSFQNIPYAQPPVGELRFKAPQPADSWEDTRDATQDLPQCIQANNTGGQEDCLYLNIYTPGLPEESINLLPVMVFIHGGSFTSGSATESSYGAQFLLTKDIILVVINYRVGIFGFLSLDDPNLGVTGNAGLKDQVLALEWIRDNIEYFGGDSNNVLIFGESAGSRSVQCLLLSPMANGLFHKAISQSGDAIGPLNSPETRNNAVVIAQALDIDTSNWESMLKSLQEYPADDLAITAAVFTPTYWYFTGPIIEVPSNIGPIFIQENPIDIIREGRYNHVPFIIGHTDAEGLLYQYRSRQETGQSMLIEDFTELVPKEFHVNGTPLETLLAFVIQNFYYGDTQPSRDNITEAVKLTTDFSYAFPSYRTAREYIKTAVNPIYFYYFTAITGLNILKNSDETVAAYPGAGHSDDIGYLFYLEQTPDFTIGSAEELALRRMVEFWTNFAIYGNPTPEESSNVMWEPLEQDQFNYLHIATDRDTLVTNAVPEYERMNFWWSLFSQYT